MHVILATCVPSAQSVAQNINSSPYSPPQNSEALFSSGTRSAARYSGMYVKKKGIGEMCHVCIELAPRANARTINLPVYAGKAYRQLHSFVAKNCDTTDFP